MPVSQERALRVLKPCFWLDEPHSVCTPVFELNWEPPEGRARGSLYPKLLAHSRCSANAGRVHGGCVPAPLPPSSAPLDESLSPPEPRFFHLENGGGSRLSAMVEGLCPPPNSYIEVLTPNVTVLRGGAFGG